MELERLIQTLLGLWDGLFLNQGALVNCNDLDQFAYRGCGSLIRQHESLAGQLDKAVIYLAETDRLIRHGFGPGDDSLLIGTVSGAAAAVVPAGRIARPPTACMD